MLKAKLKKIWRLPRHIPAAVLALTILLSAWLETAGVPDVFCAALQNRLLEEGLLCSFQKLRAGIFRGLIVDGLAVHDAAFPELVAVRAKRLHIYPDYWQLLTRARLRPRSIQVHDGQVLLAADGAAMEPALRLEQVSAKLRLRGNALHVNSLNCRLNGMAVSLAGTLYGLAGGRERPPALAGDGATGRLGGFSLRGQFSRMSPEARQLFEHLVRQLCAQKFRNGNARLWAEIDADLACPADAEAAGGFDLPHLVAGDLALQRASGRFSLAGRKLRFDELLLLVNSENVTTGEMRFDLAARTVAGTFAGTMLPAQAMRLVGLQPPALLTAMSFGAPLRFSACLQESGLAPENWDLTLDFSGRNLRFRDLLIEDAGGELAFASGVLEAKRLEATLAGGTEQVSGSGRLHLADMTVEGRLAGRCSLYDRAVQAGALPPPRHPGWLVVWEKAPPEFEFILERSPCRPGLWRASGGISGGALRVGRVLVEHCSGRMSLEPGLLRMHDGHLRLPGKPAAELRGGISFFTGDGTLAAGLRGSGRPLDIIEIFPQLPRELKELFGELAFSGDMPVVEAELERSPLDFREWRGSLGVRSEEFAFRKLRLAGLNLDLKFLPRQLMVTAALRVPEQEQPALSLNLGVDLERRRLRGNLEAWAMPPLIFTGLNLPGREIFDAFKFASPPHLVAELSDSPYEVKDWLGNGVWETGAFTYTGKSAADTEAPVLEVNRSEGQLAFSSQRITMRGVKIELADHSDPATAELVDVNLNTGELTIRGQLRADPRVISPLLMPVSRGYYNRVWNDFRWHPARPPRIILDNLSLLIDGESENWKLDLNGSLQAEDCRYISLEADKLRADVILRLPDRVGIQNLTMEKNDELLGGRLEFNLAGGSSCSLDFSGRAAPARILAGLLPEWAAAFEPFSFPDNTQMSCRGEIFLPHGDDGQMRPYLSGSLRPAAFKWRLLPFENSQINWQLLDGDLSWELPEAGICRGRAKAAGDYDLAANAGSLHLSLERLELPMLLAAMGLDAARTAKGLGELSGSCELDMLKVPDKAMAFSGAGSLRFDDANLWQLPFFNTLSVLLGIRAAGRISTLDAGFIIKENRFEVPNFETNGTILALTGGGSYDWGSDRLDFLVRGQLLKNLPLIPRPLSPLGWIMEGAELKGSLENHKWRPTRPFSGFFRMFKGKPKEKEGETP